MRRTAFTFLFAVLFLAGCDSMPEGVRQRFEAPQPQVRVYPASQQTVFEAAQHAVRQIGFRTTRTGAAQGIINAISDIQPANALGEARQYSLEVRLNSQDTGHTEVAVVLREQQESASFAGATDIPLRQHGLYESYFAALETDLRPKEAVPAAPSK
jgi:hypothetical protein